MNIKLIKIGLYIMGGAGGIEIIVGLILSIFLKSQGLPFSDFVEGITYVLNEVSQTLPIDKGIIKMIILIGTIPLIVFLIGLLIFVGGLFYPEE